MWWKLKRNICLLYLWLSVCFFQRGAQQISKCSHTWWLAPYQHNTPTSYYNISDPHSSRMFLPYIFKVLARLKTFHESTTEIKCQVSILNFSGNGLSHVASLQLCFEMFWNWAPLILVTMTFILSDWILAAVLYQQGNHQYYDFLLLNITCTYTKTKTKRILTVLK